VPIVGTGIARFALACALRQRGITAEVVERVTEWEPSGAGRTANAVGHCVKSGLNGRSRPR
jgi:2-polyprenyl-6-methoxyphenol hydroxylase-like FAD-dependent oxidoreductase